MKKLLKKLAKTQNAELDQCTAVAEKIRAAEQLDDQPARIVLDAAILLTLERNLAGRPDQIPPSELRMVLEMRLNDPTGYLARIEQTRPAMGLLCEDAVLSRA